MPKTATFNIPTTINIGEQRVCDLLTTGIEVGMASWAQWDNRPEGVQVSSEYEYDDFRIGGSMNNDDSSLNGNRFAVIAMTEGCHIDVYDSEEPDKKLGTLSRFNVIRALNMMADGKDIKGKGFPKRHFADFLAENDDAITGDVFLQLAVMGEIVFG